MTNREFIFQTSGSNIFKEDQEAIYQENGKKYLTCVVGGSNLHAGFSAQLVFPDDNSDLVHHVRTDPEQNDLFSTPFSNLEFRRKFHKNKLTNRDYDALFIKDINQVKRIGDEYKEPVAQPLTFKVISQKKENKVFNDFSMIEGDYYHQLEVEPFSPIEGLTIKQIDFVFGHPMGPLQTKNGKLLVETELYNSKLLDESVGKTFTIGVKNWKIDRYSADILRFYNDKDFELDSFKEVIETPKQTSENDNKSDKPENESPRLDDKDKKRKFSLEEEIRELKKRKEDSSELQVEVQKKIEEKEEELKALSVGDDEDKDQKTKEQDNSQNGNDENFKNWTREQLVKEIKKLKAEIEALKSDKTMDSLEKQTKLQPKLERLERLERFNNDNSNSTSNNYSSFTKLVVGGALLSIIGLVAVILIKKKQRLRK